MPSAPHGFLRVGAASPPVHVADPERNADAILAVVERARAEHVQVLVFPELALTGYTCADLFFGLETLVAGAERALGRIAEATRDSPMLLTLGLPVRTKSRLFNAAALVQSGRVLGVVAKTFLPGYSEYYEERWFSSSRDAASPTLHLLGEEVPFGADLLFQVEDEPTVTFAVEVCEDLWAPIPPSSHHAVAGASVILNPSASTELIGKAAYRRELVRQQSSRTLCAYVFPNAGVHESTTDVVFGGQVLIAECGAILAESERFRRDAVLLVADVDVQRIQVERVRQTSFAEAIHEVPGEYRRVDVAPIASSWPRRLARHVEPHPFVPNDPASLDVRCGEVFAIQTAALARRLEHTGIRRAVVGISGGIDSTLALLVTTRTFDLLGRPRGDVLAVTLPAFGTTGTTLESARRLAEACGTDFREIDVRAACEQHIRDIGLDPEDRESATYQNVQARERTQLLMDLANKEAGLVVGTGDLSELALGFCTFGGDHLSMYNVNAGIPKTLVIRLVEWFAGARASAAESAVLRAVLDTPVSPELVPPGEGGRTTQHTEDIIGPYELHDFFLHCVVRLGASPRKILVLAEAAFEARYDADTLRRWLRVFLERFFAQQFKRSALPDGPKVGSVSLSPRGDWRMPSDASPQAWLAELED